jgi:hypothetical protein
MEVMEATVTEVETPADPLGAAKGTAEEAKAAVAVVPATRAKLAQGNQAAVSAAGRTAARLEAA